MHKKIFSWLIFFLLFSFQLSAEPKTVAIFTYAVPGGKPWDCDSIHSGITGSEEAVIYMSQALAKLGYRVVVFGTPPAHSPHGLESANPRFVPLDFKESERFDIGISWRMPNASSWIKNRANNVYFWPHDTPHPSYQVSTEEIETYKDVLWISSWQREPWIASFPAFAKFTKVFGNGINPDQFSPIRERENPYSCIYASNYARGLEILLDLWPAIKQQFPQATLDIYYGWQHWGLLSPSQEKKMKYQVEALKLFDVKEHGMVSHEELHQAFAKASFWTYPCIYPETFCITGIKAQMAGACPVIIDGSALPETVALGFRCTQSSQYYDTLVQALLYAESLTLEQRKAMGRFVEEKFTWKKIAQQWDELFTRDSRPNPQPLAVDGRQLF